MKDIYIRMIGFRNILMPGYADIDRSIVYRVIQENLNDIEALKKVFAQFL